MVANYLTSIHQSFEYYKLLGEKTIQQRNDQQLFQRQSENDNSVAIIVKHLWGNMMSRWTHFLTEDGEKKWRKRDEEFESDIVDREELMAKWKEGWQCLFSAIESVNEENFDQLVYICNQGHSMVEAFHRQLAHYAYHIGQLVYVGKALKGEEWKSLSIPKGDSEKFNMEKFNLEKRQENFTQEPIHPKDNKRRKEW